jgi:dTDP-4-amino-4,6-dideoxygalactose transaminase
MNHSAAADHSDAPSWPNWPPDDTAIFESLSRVWRNGDWGKYHSEIADKLSLAIQQKWQCPHARLTCSGTIAVELALRAVGVKSGDEVVVAAYDYPGNLRCIELIGAKPVLVDILPDTPSIDPESLRSIEGESIKAVVVSHLYGQLADILAIRQICRDRGWMLVEDACQVPGAGWDTDDGFRPVGSFADATTLSFGGSKPLTAGSGGAVLTRHDAVATRMRTFVERPSDSLAMSPLQCAVLLPQLETLESLNRQRATTVERLARLDWSRRNSRVVHQTEACVRHAFYKMALRVADDSTRTKLDERFHAMGVEVGEGFRSCDRMSQRRVRKPVSLDQSARFAKEVMLIDHRYLLDDRFLERLGSL